MRRALKPAWKVLARHHLIEFSGCSSRRVGSAASVETALERFCEEAGLNEVRRARHAFVPHGLTVALILKESHLVLSTWPEHRYAAMSLQLCAPVPGLDMALRGLRRRLGATGLRRRRWRCG